MWMQDYNLPHTGTSTYTAFIWSGQQDSHSNFHRLEHEETWMSVIQKQLICFICYVLVSIRSFYFRCSHQVVEGSKTSGHLQPVKTVRWSCMEAALFSCLENNIRSSVRVCINEAINGLQSRRQQSGSAAASSCSWPTLPQLNWE